MGGVDHGDQLRGSLSCTVEVYEKYKYIFCFLLDTAITNAYILSSFDVKTDLPMATFSHETSRAIDRQLHDKETCRSSSKASLPHTH